MEKFVARIEEENNFAGAGERKPGLIFFRRDSGSECQETEFTHSVCEKK